MSREVKFILGMLLVGLIVVTSIFVGRAIEGKEKFVEGNGTLYTGTAEMIAQKIFYVQIKYVHSKKTVCFAFVQLNGPTGGPALASLSCDQVPPELLETKFVYDN